MDPHYNGVIFQTHGAEMIRRLRTSFPAYQVLDVRSSSDFANGHIPGALNIEADRLELTVPKALELGGELFVIGTTLGDPAIRQASLALMAHGAPRIVELPGGMMEWRQAGGRIETGVQQAA